MLIDPPPEVSIDSVLDIYATDGNRTPSSMQVDTDPNNSPRYYYVYNGRGNVVVLVDDAGNLVAHYHYDRFCNSTDNTEAIPNANGWVNPYRYDGRVWWRDGVRYDAADGLFWLRVRAYDPTLGRFLPRDPLGRVPVRAGQPVHAGQSGHTKRYGRPYPWDRRSRMTRDAVRAYYAQFGEREWARLTHPTDGAVEYAVNRQLLAAHLPPTGRVLDLGGGPGRYTIWLAQRGYAVTLADLSPNLLAIARERIAQAGVAHRVEAVVEADACDLSRWEDGRFAAVVSLGPFYHLPK